VLPIKRNVVVLLVVKTTEQLQRAGLEGGDGAGQVQAHMRTNCSSNIAAIALRALRSARASGASQCIVQADVLDIEDREIQAQNLHHLAE